jgi:hypothetical protein
MSEAEAKILRLAAAYREAWKLARQARAHELHGARARCLEVECTLLRAIQKSRFTPKI